MSNIAVYDVLSMLSATPGRNDKIAILTTYNDFDQLRDVCKYALDPYIQYYIKKIPKYTPTESGTDLKMFIEQLPLFYNRQITGNQAIAHLQQLLSSMDSKSALVAERIIKKDLRCGVAASTINKVHTDLIPTYPCLLARPYNERTIRQIKFPAYSQIKADGMRANVIYRINDDGSDYITIRGRSGKVVDLLGTMDDDFIKLGRRIGYEVVIDGELVVVDDDGTAMERKKGNGIISKAVRDNITLELASKVRMRAWDLIPYDQFVTYTHAVEYRTRYKELADAINDVPSKLYRAIETKEVNTLKEALDHFSWALLFAEEGTVLKNMHGIWENKRSADMLKLKADHDCDLVVVDWIEGTGKYTGMLGALLCESACGGLRVHVGSGYTDHDRSSIGQEVIGKIVTTKYNERIKSELVEVESLFLPRYIEIREDKTTANMLDEIE